jgi:ABC-type branched-subunit amino acid transport system substrate-binding protein
MSTALSGPAGELGRGMQLGVEIYFARINVSGGIGGRQLKLITYDDGYEPERAALNVRELIDRDHVLALIGNVGTPTAVVTVPIANQKKTLLYGSYSGADILRKTPPDRYVINFRASYAEETSAMIKALLSIGIKPDAIAFFIQDDSYGQSGYLGAIQALMAEGFPHPEMLPHGRYLRNTLNVEEGLADLINGLATPKAIILVGAYAPIAKFIKKAKSVFSPSPLFLNVSFVGTTSLARELGKEGENVIVTQVVPPFDSALPAEAQYQADLKKYGDDAQPSFVSWEGYLAAKLFVIALEHAAAENALTREGIIDAFEQMRDVNIGIGVKISFDKEHHQALHKVWPTIWKNGQFVSFDWGQLPLYQHLVKIAYLDCAKAPGLNDRKSPNIKSIWGDLRSFNRGSFRASPDRQFSLDAGINEVK